MPVVRIDGRTVADGKHGPIASALRRAFHSYAVRRNCAMRPCGGDLPTRSNKSKGARLAYSETSYGHPH